MLKTLLIGERCLTHRERRKANDKTELANLIVEFAHWDGIKNPEELCRRCTKAELQDMYDYGSATEDEYFDHLYEN